MSQYEIDAASQVVLGEFNAQLQPQLTWEPSFAVVDSYYAQAVRSGALTGERASDMGDNLRNAEKLAGGPQNHAAIKLLENVIRGPTRPGSTISRRPPRTCLALFADSFRREG